MQRTKKIIYLALVLVIVIGVYFYIQGKKIPPQTPPTNITDFPPVVEQPMPNKDKGETSTKIEKQPLLSPPPATSKKIERSSSVPSAHEDTVNLEEQSYSIHKEKKEIAITPGVILQPGKSVNLKIGEDMIKVERDKTYHPGGYNVLWEKKY